MSGDTIVADNKMNMTNSALFHKPTMTLPHGMVTNAQLVQPGTTAHPCLAVEEPEVQFSAWAAETQFWEESVQLQDVWPVGIT